MTVQQQTRRTSTDATSAGTSTGLGTSPSRGTRGNAATQDRIDRSPTGRNPDTYTDSDGTGSTHAPVSADDALNVTEDAAPERVPGEVEVRPLYTDEHPLLVAATPAEESLYERREPTGECTGDGWVVASGIMGSTARPSIVQVRDERTIFVGSQPAVADISQGSLGDCYFLAAVTGVAQSDPGHLRDMFTVNGNQVVVRLYSYDTAAATWQPRDVSVDMNFLHATDEHGGVDYLMASGFRMGETPTRGKWYASVDEGEDLWVCEDAEYEFALWAPLLEKAYARLAERFGQYGGAYNNDANSNTDADGNALSGYQVIDGGFSQYCYGMLYGNAEVANDYTDIDYDAEATGSELVAANLPLIEQMLKVNGQDMPGGQVSYMTISTDSSTIVSRLKDQLDRTLDLDGVDRYDSFVRSLRWVHALCARYQAAETGGDQPKVDAAANEITRACTRMADPAAWPILGSSRADGAYRDLRDLLQVAQNIGTDASDGRRLTYADHAYSVLGISLRDAKGAPLVLSGADLPARKDEIDPLQSSVRLRNPHGTNEPDADGDGADDGLDDGAFSMPLAQAIRVFSMSEQSVVRT